MTKCRSDSHKPKASDKNKAGYKSGTKKRRNRAKLSETQHSAPLGEALHPISGQCELYKSGYLTTITDRCAWKFGVWVGWVSCGVAVFVLPALLLLQSRQKLQYGKAVQGCTGKLLA